METAAIFFTEYKQIFVIAHVFSVVCGMGAAIVSDVLFNFYIKDKNINPTEHSTLEVISRIIWGSLALIVLTGLALFLSDPVAYANSTKFVLKVAIVAVIIVNGFMFWKITHKSLKHINFTDTDSNNKYVRVRKLSFAFGAISLVSWLTVFVLGSVSSIPVSLSIGASIYAVIILFAIIASQALEYFITHKK
jgi:hypothetical protein